jgi:hypothetical protein
VAEPKSAQHARLGHALRAINIAMTNLLKTIAALDSSLLAIAQRANL